MTAAEVRALLEGVTEGPWEWFGNTKFCEVYLATKNRGRVLVMDFVRWGMSGAQPRFQVALNGEPDSGVMRNVGEMAKNEEVSKPAVLFGPLYEAPHRKQFTGIGHPDARFIAASRMLVPELLARVEALEEALQTATGAWDAHLRGAVKRAIGGEDGGYRMERKQLDEIRALVAAQEGGK